MHVDETRSHICLFFRQAGSRTHLPTFSLRGLQGLPRYFDSDESDVFLLSGMEDLVPVLEPNGLRHNDETTAPGLSSGVTDPASRDYSLTSNAGPERAMVMFTRGPPPKITSTSRIMKPA